MACCVLLDEATGKVAGAAAAGQTEAARRSNKSLRQPAFAAEPSRLTLEGKDLEDVSEVVTTIPGATTAIGPGKAAPGECGLTIPATDARRVYQVSVKSPAGTSGSQPFIVDLFPPVAEIEQPSLAAHRRQDRPAGDSVVGKIDRAGAVDWFRFEAEGRADRRAGADGGSRARSSSRSCS